MKKLLITLTAMLSITLTVSGQNLFFFGDKSYPSTETFAMRSNSDMNDLIVRFAKDGSAPIVAVSLNIGIELMFSGALIIYLDNGDVITCKPSGRYEYVDRIASAIYTMTDEQLEKMKTSNINTVRFTVKSASGAYGPLEGNFTASNTGANKRTDFPAVINSFFK